MNGARILLADTDPTSRAPIAWALKAHGFHVTAAAAGPDVLAHLEARAPDLLVLDGDAPGAARPLLERLRADERWRELPVVLMADTPELAAAGARGLTAEVVPKPVRVRDLVATVRALLRAGHAARELREALHLASEQLARTRDDADSQRKLVDILQEVTGQLSQDEIYRVLARRVARALDISRSSVVLARPGDRSGILAVAHEEPSLRHVEISLDRYPEIRTALEDGIPVLVQDVWTHPLFAEERQRWEREGITVRVRSVITIPFSLDRLQSGVCFLRTEVGEPPLTLEDLEFADAVVKAAVAAIRRARLIETTRADNARLEALATTDALTLLHNRRAFLDRTAVEMDRARRYGTVLSLLMVDLDHFKRINDTFGHLVGDDVLRSVAGVLQSTARTVDLVARYGGEEFVVVLPETGAEGALAFAERIRERIAEQRFGPADQPLPLTVSVGVATFPGAAVETTEDLLAQADDALYRAKSEGRNRVCL